MTKNLRQVGPCMGLSMDGFGVGGRIGEVETDHWGSPGSVLVAMVMS